MKPWEVLQRTPTPDGVELTLTRHTSEYLILAGGHVLMSSRMHGSEDALAELGCRRARALHDERVHDLQAFKTLLANAVRWAGRVP